MRRPWKHPTTARHGAADLCLREVGLLLPRRFARRAAASEVRAPPPSISLSLSPPTSRRLDRIGSEG